MPEFTRRSLLGAVGGASLVAPALVFLRPKSALSFVTEETLPVANGSWPGLANDWIMGNPSSVLLRSLMNGTWPDYAISFVHALGHLGPSHAEVIATWNHPIGTAWSDVFDRHVTLEGYKPVEHPLLSRENIREAADKLGCAKHEMARIAATFDQRFRSRWNRVAVLTAQAPMTEREKLQLAIRVETAPELADPDDRETFWRTLPALASKPFAEHAFRDWAGACAACSI